MPRPNMPPTPAASTEIAGKDPSPTFAKEKSFNLPPPAMVTGHSHGIVKADEQTNSAASSNFSLPPPPTRSRTIIQMKPKMQHTGDTKPTTHPGQKSMNKKTVSSPGIVGKKQPSSTSVAGKRIARKTAHSVIERRRRSKMNEEFATLKSMIPACTDQDMHKLAILQASIDYLRYLQTCISDLKAANNSLSTPLVQPQAPLPRPPELDEDEDVEDKDDDDDDDDEDVTMANTDSAKNSSSDLARQSDRRAYASPQSVTLSPALRPQSSHQTSSHTSSVSALSSPAIEPQQHKYQGSSAHTSLSTSTSPTIVPNKEQDQEATAALLMLNKYRGNPKGGRGMSVKDLLSP